MKVDLSFVTSREMLDELVTRNPCSVFLIRKVPSPDDPSSVQLHFGDGDMSTLVSHLGLLRMAELQIERLVHQRMYESECDEDE
jgi:hypothetical protein